MSTGVITDHYKEQLKIKTGFFYLCNDSVSIIVHLGGRHACLWFGFYTSDLDANKIHNTNPNPSLPFRVIAINRWGEIEEN